MCLANKALIHQSLLLLAPRESPQSTFSGCSAPWRSCTLCFSSPTFPLWLFFFRFSHCGSPSSQ